MLRCNTVSASKNDFHHFQPVRAYGGGTKSSNVIDSALLISCTPIFACMGPTIPCRGSPSPSRLSLTTAPVCPPKEPSIGITFKLPLFHMETLRIIRHPSCRLMNTWLPFSPMLWMRWWPILRQPLPVTDGVCLLHTSSLIRAFPYAFALTQAMPFSTFLLHTICTHHHLSGKHHTLSSAVKLH